MNTTNQDITDVEFKEVAGEAAFIQFPNPVSFLTQALVDAGYKEPEAWKKDLHPQAELSESIDERLFLTNRALGLYLSEVSDCGDNVVPRMFISEKQNFENWSKIIVEGIVPWLTHKFDASGKRVDAPIVVARSQGKSFDAVDEGAYVKVEPVEASANVHDSGTDEVNAVN